MAYLSTGLTCFIGCLILFFTPPGKATEPGGEPIGEPVGEPAGFYQQKLDVQVRYDNRSDRSNRSQFRLRFYPQLNLSDQWSLHSFVVTGDDFSSSHNTFGDEDSEQIAVRRIYLRRTHALGKTEFGVIPTYKGRVSATGMSKDGWFQGIRHVYEAKPGHKLELVAGAINSTDPNKALSLANNFNLFEFEYSATINEQFSMEFGAERIIEGNYLRSEVRFHQSEQVWFAEFVRRVDDAENKLVLGLDSEFTLGQYPVEMYAYYAYVSADFGQRAELTEDYLGTGHGGSIEVSGALPMAQLDWFSRIDMVGNTRRVLIGLKRSF